MVLIFRRAEKGRAQTEFGRKSQSQNKKLPRDSEIPSQSNMNFDQDPTLSNQASRQVFNPEEDEPNDFELQEAFSMVDTGLDKFHLFDYIHKKEEEALEHQSPSKISRQSFSMSQNKDFTLN